MGNEEQGVEDEKRQVLDLRSRLRTNTSGQGSLRTRPRVHAMSIVETRNNLREEVTKVMTRSRT